MGQADNGHCVPSWRTLAQIAFYYDLKICICMYVICIYNVCVRVCVYDYV